MFDRAILTSHEGVGSSAVVRFTASCWVANSKQHSRAIVAIENLIVFSRKNEYEA
jgi:hypothetical protein